MPNAKLRGFLTDDDEDHATINSQNAINVNQPLSQKVPLEFTC